MDWQLRLERVLLSHALLKACGDVARHSRQHKTYTADVVVDLKADGTYNIIKDRHGVFAPRDERLYAIRHPSETMGEEVTQHGNNPP